MLATSSIVYNEPLYRASGRVLVIVPEAWPYVTGAERELLDKILGAVHLGTVSVQVLTMNPVSSEVLNQYMPKRVLIFGCDTTFELPEYTVNLIDGIPTLKATALRDLDAETKRKLWDSMKELFQLP